MRPDKARGRPLDKGGPEMEQVTGTATTQSVSRGPDPDAEQVEAARARTLLELAGGYTRLALNFPGEVAELRRVVAELLFEVAILRGRLEHLERRAGVGR